MYVFVGSQGHLLIFLDIYLLFLSMYINDTVPETYLAPKNAWLEYHFPIGETYFQVLC